MRLNRLCRSRCPNPVAGNWITYNGEIYIYRELRSELPSAGEVFLTRTDTEVILKTYARWGQEGISPRGAFLYSVFGIPAKTRIRSAVSDLVAQRDGRTGPRQVFAGRPRTTGGVAEDWPREYLEPLPKK